MNKNIYNSKEDEIENLKLFQNLFLILFFGTFFLGVISFLDNTFYGFFIALGVVFFVAFVVCLIELKRKTKE